MTPIPVLNFRDTVSLLVLADWLEEYPPSQSEILRMTDLVEVRPGKIVWGESLVNWTSHCHVCPTWQELAATLRWAAEERNCCVLPTREFWEFTGEWCMAWDDTALETRQLQRLAAYRCIGTRYLGEPITWHVAGCYETLTEAYLALATLKPYEE